MYIIPLALQYLFSGVEQISTKATFLTYMVQSPDCGVLVLCYSAVFLNVPLSCSTLLCFVLNSRLRRHLP